MSFIDVIVAKIVPHDCLGCRAEGSLACEACLFGLSVVPERCYRCQMDSPGWQTCLGCQNVSSLRRVRAATPYTGLAKKLIWKLKSAGAQEAARLMAARLAPLLATDAEVVIVSVPTASTRVRQRGYDQARLLGRQLAKQTHLFWVDCLARSGQAHQVGASREQRSHQLRQAFRVTQQRFVRGAHIILVDDVVTTGATLEAAAQVLKEAGAVRIDAIVFAQTLIERSKEA